MFSTKERIEKHTPKSTPTRAEFIQLLVDEFYHTSDTEAQKQVTANLANFAYDPFNYDFLKQSGAVKLFLELLDHSELFLVNNAVTGLCNICLDLEINEQLVHHLDRLIRLLERTESENIKANVLTILIYLHQPILRTSFQAFGKSIQTNNPVTKNLLDILNQRIQQ